jgi:hypothetical protein
MVKENDVKDFPRLLDEATDESRKLSVTLLSKE